jgi:hypothetical protein
MVVSHEISRVRQPDVILGTAQRCIYCGATPAGGIKLEDEHIIADGIGGYLILVDGSCRQCAEKINKFEQPIQKTYFGATRHLNKIESSKKKKKGYVSQQSYYLHEEPDGIRWEGPGRLNLPDKTERPLTDFYEDAVSFEIYNCGPTCMYLDKPKPGLRFGFSAKPVDSPDPVVMGSFITIGMFQQFLAKTAHAYASAVLGEGAFKPYLVDFILGPAKGNDYRFIGQSDVPPMPSNELHNIAVGDGFVPVSNPMFRDGTGAKAVYVVCLQLFAYLNTPVYEVVVGEPA